MVTCTSFSTLAPNSSATMAAVSKSTTWLTEAITPRPISFLMTLLAVCFRRLASSPTVISSGICTFSWALRAFSSWMRCRRSASVSRFFWKG